MAKSDYYKVLGVSPTAQPDDIRKAYRTLSKKYHPDLNPDLRLYSETKMKELIEAYDVLNDTQKRKDYDKQPQFQPRKFASAGRKGAKDDASKAPKKEEPKGLLGMLLGAFKKKDDAPQGKQYDPKQSDMHFTLGLTMTETESFYQQAKGEFRLAIQFRPDHKEATYNLGLMCYKLGEFEEAITHFQKVLSFDKEDQFARKMISLLKED